MLKKISLCLFTMIALQACGLQLLDPNARNNAAPAVPNTNDDLYSVGGTVMGLPMGKDIDVTLNEAPYTLTTNGQFTFPETLTFNQSYTVQINNGPGAAYICTVDKGNGQIQSDVNDVLIQCTCDVDSLGSGAGTPLDPYKVYTAQQFNDWAASEATLVNSQQNFLQVCELDFVDVSAPSPMGTRNKPFNGSYDGNEFFMINYSSGPQVPSDPEQSVTVKGIFGYTLNASIARVRLADISIAGTSNMVIGRMGSLIGQGKLTSLEDIYGKNIQINLDQGSYGAVGGLVGFNVFGDQEQVMPKQKAARNIHLENITILRDHPNAQLLELSLPACGTGTLACNVGGVFGILKGVAQNIVARNVTMVGCDVNCGGFAGRYNQLEVSNMSDEPDGQDLLVHDSYIDGGYILGGMFGLLYADTQRVSFDGTVYASRVGSGCVGGLVGYATPQKGALIDATVSADIQAFIANPLEVGFVAGHLMQTQNVSYDANFPCPFCEVINDVNAQSNVLEFYNGTDSAMQNWDTQDTWCIQSGEFADLQSVPYPVCASN